MLAETGHRVIRVERSSGDDVRRAGPALKEVSLDHGAVHQFLNAGKESLTLNLETTGGVEILAALARVGDCVVITTPFQVPADWFFKENPKISVVEVSDVENEICALPVAD